MSFRQRFQVVNDRILSILLVMVIAGSIFAFGGRVWWGPPALAALTMLLAIAGLFRAALAGEFGLMRSPLTLIGLLGIGLAVAQLAPVPAAFSARLSPASHAAYSLGMLPERARLLDPTVELPEAAPVRTPVSLDRSATLHSVALGVACFTLFWTCSRFSDHLGHLYLIWGSILAGFFANTALAVVQISCRSSGLYGFIEPGRGSKWLSSLFDLISPNAIDVLEAPGTTVLRSLGSPTGGHLALALPSPERGFVFGSQMGGSGAFLALGAIAMPLALGMLLQLIAPRGSREPLSSRLASSGHTSLVILLFLALFASALLIGLLAGPLFSIPFALAMIFSGLPSARSTGLGWRAVGLTFLLLIPLGGGAAIGDDWADSTLFPAPVEAINPHSTALVWSDSLAIVRDFPWVGTGVGTFSSVYPYYKSQNASATTASSSLLQWWVETGVAGIVLLAMSGIWVVWRTPGAIRRVGTADRSLAFGLIGAAVGFTLFSVVHWTVDLASVALAASAVGGILNRWLAGGTDLFVERG